MLNDTWAWDFRMPSGVPIVAAAPGTVRLARGDSHTGGCDPSYASEANYVVITHPNGLETQYLHLESVVVSAGDVLKEGDLLGYSGKTGWACGSHLHFKVARPEGQAWNNPSVPARIKGYGDPIAESWIASPACEQSPLPVAQGSGSQGEVAAGAGKAVPRPPSSGTNAIAGVQAMPAPATARAAAAAPLTDTATPSAASGTGATQ
jgi:hypothetical protein